MDNSEEIPKDDDHSHGEKSCPYSQIYYAGISRMNGEKFNIHEICRVCGDKYMTHSWSNENDDKTLVDCVHNSISNVNLNSHSSHHAFMESKQGGTTHLQSNQQKTIRECTKHPNIMGSFNSRDDLPIIFLSKYENEMGMLACDDYEVWKRVLPSVIQKRDDSEKEWIMQNISNVQDLTWQQSKDLFCKHWFQPNQREKLAKLFTDCRQGQDQSVTDFINEFKKLMQRNEYKEDSRICTDFKGKLLPYIQSSLDREWASKYGLNSNYNLDKLMEMAIVIGASSSYRSSSTNFQHKPSSYEDNRKRKSFERQVVLKSDLPLGAKHCIHHPDAISHNTADCRNDPNKNLKSSGSHSPSSLPPRASSSYHTDQMKKNTNSQPSYNNNKRVNLQPRKSPSDKSWSCIICHKSAPGHMPADCPEKTKKE